MDAFTLTFIVIIYRLQNNLELVQKCFIKKKKNSKNELCIILLYKSTTCFQDIKDDQEKPDENSFFLTSLKYNCLLINLFDVINLKLYLFKPVFLKNLYIYFVVCFLKPPKNLNGLCFLKTCGFKKN